MIDRTPNDITLSPPDEASSDDFEAGCQMAQALLDRMREGTADVDDLFRQIILAVHAPEKARGLCTMLQEVLKVFGAGCAEAQVLKTQLAAAVTVIVGLGKKLEEADAYLKDTDAKRRAFLEKAEAVLDDVKAAVPRKQLKVERAVEFIYDGDGQITGAAVVLGGSSPQPSA